MRGSRVHRRMPEIRGMKRGTPTRDGWIAYFRHPCGLEFPVKVCWCDDHPLPAPVRRRGRLVYCLPGGGEFVPDTDAEIMQAMRVAI